MNLRLSAVIAGALLGDFDFHAGFGESLGKTEHLPVLREENSDAVIHQLALADHLIEHLLILHGK